MTTLKRIFRGWFRGKEWKAKRERRLFQWRRARDYEKHREKYREKYRVIKQQVTRWEAIEDGVISSEGVYHKYRGWEWYPCSFNVVKIENTWHYRLSGRSVDCKHLLSYLKAEEIKRKYPAIFNPEVKSDS